MADSILNSTQEQKPEEQKPAKPPKPPKKEPTLAVRQARYGATATIYTIVVLAILGAVNWLAYRYDRTADTTSNGQFTLSQETQKIVTNLKKPATIVYFDTASNFDHAKGILQRYKNLAPGKISIEYVDYEKKPTLARAYGLRFPGTAYVQIGKRREAAKTLDEQGITGAFIKDLKGVRTVCFVSGSQEHALTDTASTGLSQFKTFLQRDNYQSNSITLLDKSAVPSDCNVLVVAGPQLTYTPNEVTAIKNYVEGGGRAFFMLDPPINFGQEHVSQNADLMKLLESWGVTPENDLVLEQNPVDQLFGFGPEIPLVNHYGSQPIVSDLKNTFTGFPVVRSLKVKSTDKTTVDTLFSTTNHAIATVHLDTNEVNPADPSNLKGPFVLGAAGTYDTGKSGNPGRFVVIGTSGFLDNSMIGFQANRDLAENTVNWLSSDEDLISIRPKKPEDRRLTVNQAQMSTFFYIDIIAIPVFLIILGVAIFMKRRAS
ncbi:MAG TPA: GldG family protein [Bryobacteraceae bacterium]